MTERERVLLGHIAELMVIAKRGRLLVAERAAIDRIEASAGFTAEEARFALIRRELDQVSTS